MKIFSILLILSFLQLDELKFNSYTIPYGSGKDELGLFLEPESPPIGPCAFSVDEEGSIYIADPVNSSIKVFSSSGMKLLKIIPFKGFPDDISVSKNGKIYVLDMSSSEIFEIDVDGRIEGFKIPQEFSRAPSKLLCWKDRIFIKGENKLSLLSFTNFESGEKIPYFYNVEFIEKGKGVVKKINNNGKKIAEFFVERENLVSIEFLNEDMEGNIYIQIEYMISDNDVGLEVRKMNPSGEIVSIIPIPENDYFVWTSRLFFVDEKGKIYQVLPKRDFVKVNVWE